MGRPKRSYPKGKLRLVTPKNIDPQKVYSVELEYTWNRKVIRKSTGIKVRVSDWNDRTSEIRASVPEYKRYNALLTSMVRKIDSNLAEYNDKHPNQITEDVIKAFLANKPIARRDKGLDFVDYVVSVLESDYSRKAISYSRYNNGKCCMKIFGDFLKTYNLGTYKDDGIYLGEVTPDIIDKYISWRRNIKGNKDVTINHALTPIIKACRYASKLGLFDAAIAAVIENMRIIVLPSLEDDDNSSDVKFLSDEQFDTLKAYYDATSEPRRKEYLEMFFFAYYACGLRCVDVIFMQWSNVDFERKEIRKILIKTRNRVVIPLTDDAIQILRKWQQKVENNRFVFGFPPSDFDLNDEEQIMRLRNNAEKCISQSFNIVGKELGFPLTFHMARHTFAVRALEQGLSMTAISRLLGHSSTSITEKVYAQFKIEQLAEEVDKLKL